MKVGGRLFYIGAGTSGRLRSVRCGRMPLPTYGVDEGLVVGIMAGGDNAMFPNSEGRRLSRTGAAKDLAAYNLAKG